ncbi:MAG: TRAP transporter large permease subunit [Chloroflexota bacterium]|nr:TRAP transporter large permease subunit [Chloroflexota bacterium]
MEWYYALLIIFGGLILFMMTGMPVAFAFLLVNVIGVLIWWGGPSGLEQLIGSIHRSVTTFTYLPFPMFVLMGEVMFRSGLGTNMIEALDKWLGRVPGRLGLLAIVGGTLVATLSGSGQASVALLGSTLVPEMEKRGYKKPMSLGPVLGSGGLAVMIPPSNLAVILGALAMISIGKLLIAIIIPGLLMAVFYTIYTVGRAWLQPHLAPPYDVPPTPFQEKLKSAARDILPLSLVVFAVTGLIFLGVATPSEASACGALVTFGLAAATGKIGWKATKQTAMTAVRTSVMVLFIIAGATAFSQILAFSGASKGLVSFILSVQLPPLGAVFAMMVILLILGMFINATAIMMITIPIFMPIVKSIGVDPVWFGVLYLLNMEMGGTTPPFGLYLFVMKGIAPPGVTLEDCIRAAFPYLICDFCVLMLILVLPPVALWLPGLMT